MKFKDIKNICPEGFFLIKEDTIMRSREDYFIFNRDYDGLPVSSKRNIMYYQLVHGYGGSHSKSRNLYIIRPISQRNRAPLYA